MNSSGFLQQNELEYIFSSWDQLPPIQTHCLLFDNEYEDPSTILNDIPGLFKKSSRNLKLLLNTSGYLKLPANSELNLLKNREDIINFVTYLRHWVFKLWRSEQYEWIMKEIMENVETGMRQLLFLNITSLPDYIITNGGSSCGNDSQVAAYHIFHCYLELKWLFLTIKFYLHCYKLGNSGNITVSNFERDLKILISDLIQLGVNVFNKLEIAGSKNVTPFPCVCVKELWIMVLRFVTKLQCDYNFKV